MEKQNPYEPPRSESTPTDVDMADRDVAANPEPRLSTAGTVVPRVVAAFLDNMLTLVPGMIAAVWISKFSQIRAMVALVVFVLAYFAFFEGLFGRTPGKVFAGLIVTSFDGSRCTWSQAAVRSGARLLEVNPLLFGAIPAALCIVCSRHHQRIGDKLAGTVVVRKELVRR